MIDDIDLHAAFGSSDGEAALNLICFVFGDGTFPVSVNENQ